MFSGKPASLFFVFTVHSALMMNYIWEIVQNQAKTHFYLEVQLLNSELMKYCIHLVYVWDKVGLINLGTIC